MSQFGYALAQGGAAAAASGVNTMDRQLKEESDMRAADRKLSDAERLRAIEESFTIRAEERKRQIALRQGRDIESGATGLLASEDAGAINASMGSNIDPKNADSAATLAAIRANPAAAKAYGLEDDTDLAKSKRRATAARNIGDLAAAREEDTNSRTLVGEKTAKEKGDRDERRLDILEKFQQRQAERQATLAEATLAHQKRLETSADARATAADATAQRNAIGTLLTGVNTDIKALEKEAADPMLEPAKQAVVKKQLDAARVEAQRYRTYLAEKTGVPDAPVAEPPKPAPKVGEVVDGYTFKGGDPKDQKNWAKAQAPAAAAPPAAKPPGMLASAAVEPASPQGSSGMLASDYADRQQKALERQNAIANDPELKQLQEAKAAALRAGKAVEANNLTAKYNELLRSKYGS